MYTGTRDPITAGWLSRGDAVISTERWCAAANRQIREPVSAAALKANQPSLTVAIDTKTLHVLSQRVTADALASRPLDCCAKRGSFLWGGGPQLQ
jgi:hypothetical protein